MNQEDYDKKYKNKGNIVEDSDSPSNPLEAETVTIDGNSVAPLKLNIINRSPQERLQREMDSLAETITVVGKTESGVDIIRRTGGANISGSDQWCQLMRRCGRLR